MGEKKIPEQATAIACPGPYKITADDKGLLIEFSESRPEVVPLYDCSGHQCGLRIVHTPEPNRSGRTGA